MNELQGRCNHTFLTGVYLAINAIPDAYLLLDGPPYCGYDKVLSIQGTHDIFSILFKRDSRHRICCSGFSDNKSVLDRTQVLTDLLKRVSLEEECSVLFLSSMPVATVLAVDYHQIIKRALIATAKPIININTKSMDLDWLHGYEETLFSLARNIKLNKKAAKSKDVAIVGYFFDRNEGDNIGNISELKRIFESLSLNLVSIWLDGSSLGQLKNIEKASTILSLPYARRAAKEIAGRIGANVIDLDLPFGLKKTREFLSALGGSFNIQNKVNTFIKEELDEIIPLISCLIPRYFQGKTFSVNGDPYLCDSISYSLEELGAKIKHNIMLGSKNAVKSRCKAATFYEPSYNEVFKMDFSDVDAYIGNSQVRKIINLKNLQDRYVEIGYPSENQHFLTISPYVGFRGFLNFLNRVINTAGVA